VKRAANKSNPAELLIFGNPSRGRKRARRSKAKRNGGTANHKPGCACPFCKRARGVNPTRKEKMAAARDRATKIRAARLSNSKAKTTPKKKRTTASGEGRKRRTLPSRRNPSDTKEAVKLFGTFHGRDATQIVEKQESAAIRLDYTALGDLDYIKIETPQGEYAQLDFEGDGVKLASSPDGKQLYCIGGNQNLAGVLDADSLQKDFIDLGEAREVQYVARKVHSDPPFEPVSWFHKFGEKGGALPRLMYDKLRKRIYFVGGEYFINTKAGISPGIEG
jgi:hypothetical protein